LDRYSRSSFFSRLNDFFRGRSFAELISKGFRLLRREGHRGLERLLSDIWHTGISYSRWIRLYDTLTPADRTAIRRHIASFTYKPLISVLMPVFDPPAEFLEKAIASVRHQLYPHWELRIVDDASTQPHVRAILEAAMREDDRIHVVFRRTNGHISVTSNDALALAQGEFIALLDHDDELEEHALYHVAAALDENPTLDLFYSDEDKIDAKGQRFGHYFKPDWNPDLFLAQNLICHLGVYRRRLALGIGGFRLGYEGSQDWDFALRFVKATSPDRIAHLPFILYHWRSSVSSTAMGIEAKSYAVSAGQRALVDHWRRRGIEAAITPVEAGHFLTSLPLPADPPKVSIIVCTRNRVDLLRRCVEGIVFRTTYAKREILIVDNGSDDPATLNYLACLEDAGTARIVRDASPFNFAQLNNLAVRQATGELICLLNNDVEPIHTDWLTQLAAHALRPEIGTVGAMLFYPNDTIQHAGVFLDGVAAGHLHLGYSRGAAGYGNRARLMQNTSAVTAACLVVRKAVWETVGGMDEAFAVAFNDVDFCLRVRACGYLNLWLPQAELYHHESASRGKEDTPEKRARFAFEIAHLQKRWGKLLANDPAWNPNLAFDGTHIRLADPPRLKHPWALFSE